MLRAALYTAHKELLLLVRDKAGLAVILVMPLALILIISVVQDSAWNAARTTGLDVLLVNRDDGPVGLAVEKALAGAGFGRPVRTGDGGPTTPERAAELVQSGRVRFAVIVPAGTSRAFFRMARAETARRLGRDTAPPPEVETPAAVRALAAPDVQGPMRDAFFTTFRLLLANIESRLLYETAIGQANPGGQTVMVGPMVLGRAGPDFSGAGGSELLTLRTRSQSSRDAVPSSTQHNVPAWTMFAMFFILIPMSGSIIRERNEGVLNRLWTMSAPRGGLAAGRIGLYVLVCLVQAAMMLAVGRFALPLLGLDPISLGARPELIVWTAAAAALAATCFGYLVGAAFAGPEKAAMFGAIFIVVMSALGGIMVPVALMPDVLRTLSRLSPLGWGMAAFTDLFVRGGGWAEVGPDLICLLAFAAVCFMVGLRLERPARGRP